MFERRRGRRGRRRRRGRRGRRGTNLLAAVCPSPSSPSSPSSPMAPPPRWFPSASGSARRARLRLGARGRRRPAVLFDQRLERRADFDRDRMVARDLAIELPLGQRGVCHRPVDRLDEELAVARMGGIGPGADPYDVEADRPVPGALAGGRIEPRGLEPGIAEAQARGGDRVRPQRFRQQPRGFGRGQADLGGGRLRHRRERRTRGVRLARCQGRDSHRHPPDAHPISPCGAACPARACGRPAWPSRREPP